MKNLILIVILFLSINVLGQLTPVPEYRVQNATTAFGVSVPIGAKIYDYNTGNYYVATAAIASTATITTASASLTSITGGGASSPLTTKGDIWVYSTTDARLPVGTNGQVLSANSAQATGLEWVAALSDPMTTRGDIIYRNSSNVTDRLPIGANTYVLTSDGTDVSWAAPSGGSSAYVQDDLHAAASGTSATLNMTTAGSADAQTMTGNFTLNLQSINNGQQGEVILKQDATGSRTLTINTFSDAGTTGLTEIYSGGLQNPNPTANEYTKVKYKRFGSIVTIDIIWYE